MRSVVASSLFVGIVAAGCLAPCMAATPTGDKPEISAAQVGAKPDTTAQEPASAKKQVARLGAPKSNTNAPRFGLKTTVSGGPSTSGDRAAEVKRIIDAYHDVAIKYVDELVHANTPEEVAAVNKRAPNPRSVRPFASLLIRIIASDSKDVPACDALLFLARYLQNPEVVAILEVPGEKDDGPKRKIDPMALLLEHHVDRPQLAQMIKTLPEGDATNAFLQAAFDKTHNPEVRTAAGIHLVNSLLAKDKSNEAEAIAVVMSGDRYLDGVPVTNRPTGPMAREWAERKLNEIRTLGIGKPLPEVSGEKLDGGKGSISDYRGKVVVLDVWATWCGPCCAMIPHETKMVERFKDKPFVLLSANVDQDKETLTQFLGGTPMPWDHWWVGPDSEFTKTLNIGAYPTIIVLDAKGVIRYKNLRDEKLEKAVQTLLDEAK